MLNGYWIIYRDHFNKIIKKEWHKNNPPKNYNREDETDFDFETINQELDLFSQNEMKIKSPSDFIFADVDVKTNDKITILNEGEYKALPTDPNKIVLTLWVKIPSGEKRKISPNATSQKEIIAAWGDESENWINKNCVVEIVRQNVMGQLKNVIYLHPENGAPKISVETINEEEIETDES